MSVNMRLCMSVYVRDRIGGSISANLHVYESGIFT
jgi:hypothetical protein